MPKRTWPSTPSERADRRRVVDLVRLTGERLLQFTVYDVRKTMEKHPRLVLAHSSELHRHIHALDEGLVVRVDQRLDFGEPRDDSRPSKARHQWVLPHRLEEWKQKPPQLDDLERVYHALWVSIEALGVEWVPTRAVTDVLRNVEDLALVTPRNTRNHLATLQKRNRKLVEESRQEGSRWSVWRPLGPRPDHPEFDRWVETFGRVEQHGAVVGNGHATLNSLVVELVRIALAMTRSSTWPAGRSVQIRDLRAAAARDPRAKEILQAIRVRNRSIGSVLGDLTKTRIVGRKRVHCPVEKVAAPIGSGSFYDAPDVEGYQSRRLYVPYKALLSATSRKALLEYQQEVRQAERLAAQSSGPVVTAMSRVRQLEVHRTLEEADQLIQDLNQDRHRLSKKIRQSLDERRAQLNELTSTLPSLSGVEEQLMPFLAKHNLTVEDVQAEERPLLLPVEYCRFLPERTLNGFSPPEFMSHVVSLERYPNPDFVDQRSDDPNQSARYGVDRVEALCYLAERYGGKTLFLLRKGQRLLGRTLRSPELPRLLLDSSDPEDRMSGLACLVLLGAPEAAHSALRLLRGPATDREAIDALHALLLLKSVSPAEWPEEVRKSRKELVREAAREVVLASRTGRWLLQR